MLVSLKIALVCAVVGYVYSEILTAEGMILARFRDICEENLRRSAFKPLIGCFKCVTGQLAMWLFIVVQWNSYNPIWHIFSICSAILLVSFIDKLYYKL